MSEAECDGCSCVTAYQKRKKYRIWHFVPHFQTLFCHFASPEYASGGNSRQMLHKHRTFLFTAGRHRLCCLVTTPTGVPTLVGTRHLSHNSTFQPQSYWKLLKATESETRRETAANVFKILTSFFPLVTSSSIKGPLLPPDALTERRAVCCITCFDSSTCQSLQE